MIILYILSYVSKILCIRLEYLGMNELLEKDRKYLCIGTPYKRYKFLRLRKALASESGEGSTSRGG